MAHAKDLALTSPVVIVQDAATGAVLYEKNAYAMTSIASMTKLMTAMVVLDARLPFSELIEITQDDVDVYKHSSSKLMVGTTWSRESLLELALMSSDNRAAAALARTYPGGTDAFVQYMNKKASVLKLKSTRFYDPTGLSEKNQASAWDMSVLSMHAAQYDKVRQFSTKIESHYQINGKKLHFKNTNPVVRNGLWKTLWLSKTGFTNEAGRCVTMVGQVGERAISIVLMSNSSTARRTKDIETVLRWVHKA